MQKLTCDNFIKAREFIFTHGQEIDRAWFRYHFENSDVDAFMNVLASYQYANGGFGGLWHEFAYQGPCLKCTEIAIKYILTLGQKPSAEHPVIQNTMRYLLDHYLPKIGNWGEVVVPEVNDSTHCRWSRYRGEDTSPIENEDERIEKYDANEKVCFAAFVSYYFELVPRELCSEILKYPIEHILRYWDEQSPQYNASLFNRDVPYMFEYFLDFVLYLKDREVGEKLASILCQNPTAFFVLDFARSDTDYVHLPCDVAVKTPKSFLYPTVKELVDRSLEHRLGQQKEDGRWPLGWSFGEGEFQTLQTKYEASQTTDMLVKLKEFGMIEM